MKFCENYNVSINEELAEKLTPQLDKNSLKLDILNELGELCMSQGQYHLACKKFTQAGNLIGAMQSLLRSGDTEKIIFFANISKQKDIYIMAANYLQTLDNWTINMDMMRTIVQFYTKANALKSLASFYFACAQVRLQFCCI